MQDIDWEGYIAIHRHEIDGLRAPDPRHQSKDMPTKPKMAKKRYTDKQLDRFRRQPWNSLNSSQKHAVTAYETRAHLPYSNPKRHQKDGRKMPENTPTQIKITDQLIEKALADTPDQPTPTTPTTQIPGPDPRETAHRLINARLVNGTQALLDAANTALGAGDTSRAKDILETALAAIALTENE